MRLKKLELSGFKSFAGKTALEFPHGISAIVGPNGSGKSNIVDALRWVLGEQSFKYLRSKNSADLIWAGSDKKSAKSFAGVNLHFDNRDGFFPIDFEEVVIGRKVYRDGENVYYLNQSQVRLKDIVEFLARSRLGVRGQTIVNQGLSDIILRVNPEERRGILEEALGLKEFQLKKTEAEAKLAETKMNLEKTDALVNEISPHLKSLNRQVEKFAVRGKLGEDLNALEEDYFKIKVLEILSEKDKNLSFKNELLQKIALTRKNFEEQEAAFQNQLTGLPQMSEEMSGAALAAKIKQWARHLAAILNLVDFSEVKKEIANLAGEVQTASNYFEKKASGDIIKYSYKELESARRAYLETESLMRQFELAEEKIKLKEDDVKSKMWSAGKDYGNFTATLAKSGFGESGAINLTELENKIAKLRRELSAVGAIDEETLSEHKEVSKRHEFLTTEAADLSSAVAKMLNLIDDLNVKINNDFKIGLAKISESFNHYFRIMFGGGSAKLSPENLENQVAGVSIDVNIPQKRIRDLNLLSGGERALTSIALLFAIVAVNRPPFLILDEIDASLDEENARRFAAVLKELVSETQFVLVTHNRATMEAANVLYGVTIDGDGVSKLISLKLEEATAKIA